MQEGQTGMSIELGAYTLIEPLARGGMAQVWRGVHPPTGRDVALKFLMANHVGEPSWLQSFQLEVLAAASLDHPNIIQVHDSGMVSEDAARASAEALQVGQPYLVMELVTGGTLRPPERSSPWLLLAQKLLKILDALAHAHAKGVYHLDLKPANVLLSGPQDRRQGLKLTDFGIAHVRGHRDSEPAVPARGFVGTPPYMAPEQFRADWRDFGPWTDLYALGCMTWQLVCGAPPFADRSAIGTMWAHCQSPLPPWEPRLRIVPAGLRTWVARLLEKAPEDRYLCAADARAGLLELTPELIAGARDVTRQPGKAVSAGSELAANLLPLRPVPLVGREQVQRSLWSTLVAHRRVWGIRLMVLEGPSGTGKSYLARWLCEQALEAGLAQVLIAQHSPEQGPQEGLSGMGLEHLRAFGLPRHLVRVRAEREWLRLGVEDASEVEALTELLLPTLESATGPAPAGGGAGASPVRFGSVGERLAALRRYLSRLSGERPLLLWLDDVQWGSETLEFVRGLLERSADQPVDVLLLLTVQAEALVERAREAAQLEALKAHPETITIHLGELPSQALHPLLEQHFGLSPALARRVTRSTGGNPLFAVELVRSWAQRGLLKGGTGGLELQTGATLALPDSLHQVWQVRLERVWEGAGPDAQQALELAAASGGRLVLSSWRALCRRAGLGAPDELFGRLVAQRLLLPASRQKGGAPEEEPWRFAHGMLHSALERLAREAGRWPRHQWICAEHLRAVATPEAPLDELRYAQHLLEAGASEAALGPLLRAARARFDRIPHDDVTRILDFHRLAADQLRLPASDERRGREWLLRAHLSALRGRLDEGIWSLRQLEQTAKTYGWNPLYGEAVLLRASIAHVRDDATQTELALQEAQRCFDGPGLVEQRADCLRLRGTVARARGALDLAENLLLEAVALYRSEGRNAPIAWSLTQLARVASLRRDRARATVLFEQAYELHRSVGNQRGMANCIMNAALIHLPDAPADAIPLLQRALPLLERIDDVTSLARVHNNLGEAMRLVGRYEEAERAYQQSLRIDERIGTPRAGSTRVNLAQVWLRQGNLAGAIEQLSAAEEELHRLGEPDSYPAFYAARLLCAVWKQRWTRAEALLGELRKSLITARLDPQDRWPLEEAHRLCTHPDQQALRAELLQVIARVTGTA